MPVISELSYCPAKFHGGFIHSNFGAVFPKSMSIPKIPCAAEYNYEVGKIIFQPERGKDATNNYDRNIIRVCVGEGRMPDRNL